jgi:hypothetical protein
MSPALVATLAAGAGAAAMLLLVGAVALLSRRGRARPDLEALLAASQREVDDLRRRLDELTGRRPANPEELVAGSAAQGTRAQPAEYVITHVGEAGADPLRSPADSVAVPDRLVLSATIGEPLVKVAAFSHGVRRALSAQSRNRIWFEMRREVRAARKRRRRLVKEYLRETRARDRAGEGVA